MPTAEPQTLTSASSPTVPSGPLALSGPLPPGDPTIRQGPARRSDAVVVALAVHLTRWSVPALRVTLGLVFLGFGVLKFFPGASPAEQIVTQTVGALTFGVVEGAAAVLLTAVVETVIGLTLLTGRGLKVGLIVLAVALVGMMSPAVLFADELFGDGMTLMGQYVLKDVVFVAGAAVVAAVTLGARLTGDAR
ncbi:DoxX family membrane protein [Oerskovia jenensis]|uniref:DoxX family membrane protein n=1 Tax=Oerskovia jenensis TaxID=162169 RepID=UPI0036D81CA9